MASKEPAAADQETTEPSIEAGIYPVENSENLSGRAESAHRERMVVIPVFDEYGYCLGDYEVVSGSGSAYNVDRSGGSCPDEIFQSPENGCKHYQRVVLEQIHHDLPKDGEPVAEYMMGRVKSLIETFGTDYDRLQVGRITADGHQAAFDDLIEQVDMFLSELVGEYDRFQMDVTDGEAPSIQVDLPQSIADSRGRPTSTHD